MSIVKNAFIGNAPIFSSLPEADQERLSERMHLELFRNGQLLFRKGEESTTLYLIKSGWVRLLANGGTVVASQGPGSLVGETDLFLERPRTLGAAVASDAELWLLTQEDLLEVIAYNPQTGIQLSLAFGSRLPLLDRHLVQNRLKPLPFLSGVPEATLVAMASRLVPIQKKAGEYVVQQEQPPEAMFIVESGRVQLLSSEEGGDFSELGSGESFGEMALLTGKPHSHAVQAASNAVLWALPAAEFAKLAEEHPEIRRALSQNIREPLQGQDKSRASKRLSQVPLFSGLSEEVLGAVAERLLLRHVPAGELVFSEGAPGDSLYVIDSGQVEIVAPGKAGGAVLARMGADEFFGEMALLTGKPRSSAARTATHTNLWALYRPDFDDLINRYPSISLALSRVLSQRLDEMDRRFAESHLRAIKLLSGLSSSQLEDVNRRLKPVRFRQGEVILREGAPGDEMYFVETGQVKVVRGAGREARTLAELGTGDVFGEMALLTGNPRSATVTAISEVDAWAMAKADFEDLVATYPTLAMALSRLLSERLRSADERFLREAPESTVASAAPAVVSRPAPAPRRAPRVVERPAVRPVPAKPKAWAEPAEAVAWPVPTEPVARRKPEARAIRPKPAVARGAGLRGAFDGLATWFGALSRGARIRLVLIALLLIWLIGIAAPALLISTLAAADVKDLRGAIAFVQTSTPVPSQATLAEDAVGEQAVAAPKPAVSAKALMLNAEVAAVAAPAASETQVSGLGAEPPTQVAATPTPWVIVVTNTPLPVTDTPVPPTATPPPTKAPASKLAAASSPPRPAATATAAPKKHAPRDLDARLGPMNVQIVDAAGLQPGQKYWRLVKVYWQSKEESGNDHTIYIEVVDDNGARVLGQAVEIRWQEGMDTVFVEDKAPPVYGANYPMYGTLGSYTVSIPGLPSDKIVGLGMGTAEQPAFTIHTNFFLTFQKTSW